MVHRVHLNSPQKEAIAVRFRPQFLVAFNAWIATNPLHNPKAPPGPTYMPQYQLPAQPGVRYALVAFGSALLILSIVLILRQPGLPR